MRQLPPSRRQDGNASGLTLIEVLIAMLVFTAGALALAATSAAIVRQMASSSQRAYAASSAGTRSELFHAAGCGTSVSGTDQSRGVRSDWSITRGVASQELDQRITRGTEFGTRGATFLSGVPCD